jgi:hypothetical protein
MAQSHGPVAELDVRQDRVAMGQWSCWPNFLQFSFILEKNHVWILNDLNVESILDSLLDAISHDTEIIQFGIIVYDDDLPGAVDFLCCIDTYVVVARRYRSSRRVTNFFWAHVACTSQLGQARGQLNRWSAVWDPRVHECSADLIWRDVGTCVCMGTCTIHNKRRWKNRQGFMAA